MQSKPHPLKGSNPKLAIGNSITVTRGFCPGTGGKACDSKRPTCTLLLRCRRIEKLGGFT
jgi:hypothetical protein